ncbi:heme peroxidase [Coprinopsis sp. MPI-PUGE-AT-0042]|nr:heme peroxidase [Coprinopsis sp. MPI-PUGE-AT-0042]
MSLLGRLIQRTLAAKDEEAEIIAQAASVSTSKKSTPTSADKTKIQKFLSLADSTTIDIRARLAAYRDCNASISQLPPSADERIQVISKSIKVVCPPGKHFPPVPNAQSAIPALSSEPNAFHRVVDAPPTGLPDVKTVFEQVFRASDVVQHPSGLSTLIVAFASLISLCKSYPNYEDPNVNQTAGLFDLYPLYGSTEDDARDNIRVMEPDEIGWGLLLPDAFFEIGERLEFLPPATSVLLILFNRNHNTIARRLLQENQQQRWVKPTILEEGSEKRQRQDDEIYNLAKRVNCALFRKIVTTDFLKGLLGLSPLDDSPAIDLILEGESADSQVNSVEFTLIYNWLATFSDSDVESVKEALSQIGEDLNVDDFDSWCASYTTFSSTDRAERSCVGLNREEGYKFNDKDLAEILQKATAATAHAFRPRGTNDTFRPIETSFMERARSYNVCTFNKFREALGLAPYKSFEEWCGDTEVARAAEALYKTIDNLELYTGLRAEKQLDGKGLRLGETMTYALITDMVQVVRSDPAFKEDQKLDEVTKIGADMLKTKPDNGAFGSSLPSVILANLPNNYNPNSAYGLYPFATPEKAKELLQERAEAAAAEGRTEVIGPADVDFGEPKPTNTHTITDSEAAQQILDDDNGFKNPLKQDITQLTNGLGILLGFDQDSHAKDNYNSISALLTDKGSMQRYSTLFKLAIRRYLKRYSKKESDKRIVNYQDVINGAAAAWAAEILCGVTLDEDNKLTTEDFFEKLKTINDTLFGTVEPQDAFSTLKRAQDAAKLIRRLISRSLSAATADPASDGTTLEWIFNVLRELLLHGPPDTKAGGNPRAHDFLARVAASGRDKNELTANILGFAAFSSISFAHTMGKAVSFYMSGDRVKERASLVKLVSGNTDADAKKQILGYVREAERLSPSSRVTLEALTDKVITLSTGDTLEVKKGDRVVVDPANFETEDTIVDPNRADGKGRAFFPFIEESVPEAMRAIFSLQGIEPKKGVNMMTYTKTKSEQDQGFQLEVKKKVTPYAKWVLDVFLVVLVLYFSSTFWNAVGDAIDRVNTLKCSNPTHIRPWEVYTMLPGPDNRTAPFIVTLNSPKKRRVTFVDIDYRDMQFQVSVNGKKKKLSSDFVLDKDANCGDQVEQCLAQGFSHASVIVTPGKKVIKLEWVGKDNLPGTNLVNWGIEGHRRFVWKQEAC